MAAARTREWRGWNSSWWTVAACRRCRVLLERARRVTSILIWWPQDPEAIRVRYRGFDVFATPADEFLTWLRSTGHQVDGDRYFPRCDSVAIGSSRDGTGRDDEDEDGVSAAFRFVLFAPPGYFSAGRR
jgi:hypothetical protein